MIGYLQGRVVDPLRENRALLMLCLTTTTVMLGQGIVSPVLPLFAQSFGVGAALVGATVTIFAVARLFVDLPAGYLAERVGRRILVVGGPALVALASVFVGLAPNFGQLLAFRFVTGVGSAMYMTGAIVVMADISDESNRGRLLSIYQGSLLLGMFLGPAVGGYVADALGYRSVFHLLAGLAAAASLWAFLRLPETKGRQPPSDPVGWPLSPRPLSRDSVSVRSLLFSRDFALVGLLSLAIFLSRAGSRMTLLPLVWKNRLELDVGPLGLIFSLMGLLTLVMLAPSGAMVDRFGRKAVIVPSVLIWAIALVLFAASDSVWLFVLAAVVNGLGGGLVGPAPAAYVADIAPQEARGVALGLYRTFGDVGFVVGPLFLGWLADVSSLGWALGSNALLLMACAGLFAVLARETVRRGPPLARPQDL